MDDLRAVNQPVNRFIPEAQRTGAGRRELDHQSWSRRSQRRYGQKASRIARPHGPADQATAAPLVGPQIAKVRPIMIARMI
jgi:hypothetical protein